MTYPRSLRQATVVFVDGVFDMCHVGHINIMRNAAAHGDKLYVGLGTDACCATYKRPPLMSFAERSATLLALPWVTAVLPIESFTEEVSPSFLEEHRVDVVCHGAEYDPSLNPEFVRRVASGKTPDYYRVAREGQSRARAVPLPRTAGVSTSEIIARLAHRIEQDKEAVMQRNDGGSTDTKNV